MKIVSAGKNQLINQKCIENIDEVKIAEITSTKLHSARHGNECVCSYTIYVILAVIALAINIKIGAYFAHSRWYLTKDITRIKFGTRTQWNCTQKTI